VESFYEELFPIRAYDIDFENKLKISALFNCLQDAASTHATKLKLGFNDLLSKNLFWVLSWVRIEMDEYPKFGDSISVKTWPKKKFKLYSLRDFTLTNNAGKVFAKASSAWVLLKADSKRPVDPLTIASISYQTENSAIDSTPEKIYPPENLESEKYQRKIRYSDIDINRHVNNARYVEFIMDSFDNDFYKINILKKITISFISESKMGDEIRVKKFDFENQSYILAENLVSSKEIFRCSLDWEDALNKLQP
jgi:medium-chain acyl-[acyl-carrier-protein] hydrolase